MKTNRRLTQVAGAAVLAAATLVATIAHADQLADIKKKGELVCGVLGTDEPFSFLKDPMSREIVGYDVDMCDAVAKSIGLDLKPILAAAKKASPPATAVEKTKPTPKKTKKGRAA